MKRVGFIGLGTMGKPMAEHLLKTGYPLIVYNRSEDKAKELVKGGAVLAENPAKVAQECDVLITMVSDDAALLDVFFSTNGIIQGARQGQTMIDCSTVAPETSRRISAELQTHSAYFLDAPVTGSKPAAASASLVFMVGGDPEVMEQQLDVFLTMGKEALHVGPTGSGSYTKLAHNLIVGINSAALAEGFAFAARAGVDPDKFLKIVQAGGAASKQAELKGSKMISGDFEVQFSLELMLKDLLLAAKETAQFKLPTPLLNNASALYQMGLAKGNGHLDLSSVVQCYEDWMGSRIIEAKPNPNSEEPAEHSIPERRQAERVKQGIRLQMSVHQWQMEGAFAGQSFEVILQDLSGDGLQVVSDFPLAYDMFVVITFPSQAALPPITAKIIRIDKDESGAFHYGCMMTGLSPTNKVRLEQYINDVRDGIK